MNCTAILSKFIRVPAPLAFVFFNALIKSKPKNNMVKHQQKDKFYVIYMYTHAV